MKTKKFLLLFGVMMMAGVVLSGCNDNNGEDEVEILKPLSENVIGIWKITEAQSLVDGEWISKFYTDDWLETEEFRADGIVHRVQVRDGFSRMGVSEWEIDEDSCLLKVSGLVMPIIKLTENEFGYSYNEAVDSLGQPVEGSFRWFFKRTDGQENAAVMKYLGKWNFSKSYVKENGEWVETTVGIPDEGWHRYDENGTVTFYSRLGENVQESTMYWRVNCSTGEMQWKAGPAATDHSTVTISFEDDDTMDIFYSNSYDPATGNVIEGEFKDVLIRE